MEGKGPHQWYWYQDASALSEEFLAYATDWLVKNTGDELIDLEEAQHFFNIQPMVRMFWTDAAPTTWTRPASTFNQVWLDASEYVYYLQRSAVGDGPASVSIS